jgi:DNA processing protein
MNLPKINSIAPDDNEYTNLLCVIAVVPKRLYFRGTLPKKRQISVAIVGTRRPTPYGTEVTQRLASELAQRGIIIISGLALGIDAIAHRAALAAGGTTIAVLASGVADFTPRTNARLGAEIIEKGGAVLSEYEPYKQAYPSRFIERNRLVSGLADALIVTEAALHSGTMSTVSFALEQGKEVFAVPGNITSPMSAGTNAIIRSGAHIVTGVEDIINVLLPHDATGAEPNRHLQYATNEAEYAIISLLEQGVRDGDELLTRSKLTANTYSQNLTMLEIRGVIRPLGANQWTLA